MEQRLARRHVVLLGIGHTNAHIVRMWRMNPIPDADLTCISDRSIATYSGMLPAVLAGQIPAEQMQIDLVRLCLSVGARLVVGNATGLDHARCEVLFDDRPPIPYHVLSIGIGSVPTTVGVEISDKKSTDSALLTIKPMQTFISRLTARLKELSESGKQIQVAVVGSGVAGVEILFCIRPFLAQHGVECPQIKMVSSSTCILPDVETATRSRVENEIRRRGQSVSLNKAVVKVGSESITLEDGSEIEANLVIWATGASAPPAIDGFDLSLDESGFIETDNQLKVIDKTQGTDRRPVFAVGDTGTIVGEHLPKAGVYAVRQGPILWENIKRTLNGRDLRSYAPQRSFLRLINLGDGRAIGQWKRWSFSGRWAYWLKDQIDSKFMEKFEPVSMMDATEPMQCRGCGCKLGADVLEAAIAGFDDQTEVINDDAAEVGVETGNPLLASTDFFTSPFDDAYLAGRVAAIHSASDLVATGASVTEALANVVVPEGDSSTQQRMLHDFLAGASREFKGMGAKIVGGHTIVGPRMEAGFTVIGSRITESTLRKSGLRDGDGLFLTKPLGVGVLLAAYMRSECKAHDFEELMGLMLESQSEFAQVALDAGIVAATDITGFGLAGHLLEMLEASDVAATIQLGEVPAMEAAKFWVASGIESSLVGDNLRLSSKVRATDEVKSLPEYRLLFDPQTCGGILFGVSEQCEADFLERVRLAELREPSRIGTVTCIQNAKDPLKRCEVVR